MDEKMRKHRAEVRRDLHNIIAFHRERASVAIENKKICPVCYSEDCRHKCSRCKAVSYCSKECQVGDWPTHRKVCNVYQHVLTTIKSMQAPEEKFILQCGNEALAAILLTLGIETEVINCGLVGYKRNMKPLPVVIIEERLYDVTVPLIKESKTSKSNKCKIEALPPACEAAEDDSLMESLVDFQPRRTTSPWSVAYNIDKNDRKLLVKFACRSLMEQHYLDCHPQDHKILMKLYEEYDTFQEACGESGEEFVKRMDDMCERHKTYGDFGKAMCEQEQKILKEMPLKEDTRRKVSWCKPGYCIGHNH